MNKSTLQFLRVIPFAKNSEFLLKSYLNISYYFMISPFKIVYDDNTKSYRAKQCSAFKVSLISVLEFIDVCKCAE